MSFCLLNAVCLLVFGVEAFNTYVEKVIPASTSYRSSWGNVSLSSLSLKLFYPEWANDSVPVFRSRFIGYNLALFAQAVIALLVVQRSWQAKTLEQRDWAMALAITGMLLVAPITWSHYFVLLVLPLTMIWNAPKSVLFSWLFGLATFVLWAPLQLFMFVPLGTEVTKSWLSRPNHTLPPAKPWQTICSLSVPTYALLILFYLAWRLFPNVGSAHRPRKPVGRGVAL